jgi:hypothetical protein
MQQQRSYAMHIIFSGSTPGIQKAGTVTVQGIAHRRCRQLQRADGNGYAWKTTLSA